MIVVLTAFGMLLGGLGLLGWRYAMPLGSPVDVGIPPPPPPPVDDGKFGYMYVIDGYAYVDGPHWFPATVWFLAAGVAFAFIVSVLLVRVGWRLVHGAQEMKWPIVAALSVFGGTFGLVASIAGYAAPPRLYSVVQSEPRDPANPYPNSTLVHYDLEPSWVTFTVIGVVVGLMVGSVLLLAGLRAVRTPGPA